MDRPDGPASSPAALIARTDDKRRPSENPAKHGLLPEFRLPYAGAEPLLIVGASARAAAESARRGGFRPYAIDLFADADLAKVAEVRPSRNFPYDIVDLARTVPACDWLYVGGLENYPDVVDALSADRRLLGNPGSVLRRVRDPRELRDLMCRHGVSFPESMFDPTVLRRPAGSNLPADGDSAAGRSGPLGSNWLVKRRRSSGGLGVAPIQDDALRAAGIDQLNDDIYYQRRIEGAPHGAVYLATERGTELLALSRQLTCPSRAGKQPFRYAGSVGPLMVDGFGTSGLGDKLNKIGNLATSGFRLSGIFSLDFIVDDSGTPWLLEVNPRYTASVELLERCGPVGGGESLIARHVAACRNQPGVTSIPGPPSLERSALAIYGKRIVYSEVDVVSVPERFTDELLRRREEAAKRGDWPTVADVPRAGTTVRLDEPLATVFASAATEAAVHDALAQREQELHALLAASC